MINKNNKGFTLVELIIVITILAILATIAFISFDSYSSDARDSKRLNDLQVISKQIEIKKTGGSNYVDMVGSEKTGASGSLSIAGYPTGSITNTKYKVGTANFQLLGIEQDKFKDDLYVSDYVLAGINTGSTMAFQVAATLENAGNKKALVVGNYIPRTITGTSSSGSISANKITLTSNFGVFKKGDLVKGNTSGTGVVTMISADIKILTVGSTTSGSNISGSTISLNSDETPGLIFNGSNNVVQNGSGTLPY